MKDIKIRNNNSDMDNGRHGQQTNSSRKQKNFKILWRITAPPPPPPKKTDLRLLTL